MRLPQFLQPAGAAGNKPREWFNVRNLAAGEVEILIYDVIGDSWFGGVTAADFVRELQNVQANKILLRVNSPGGAIDDANAIRNALLRHPATVESHVDGIAASAASWVAMQDRVVMEPGSKMMIHEPWDFMGGNAASFRNWADVLDKYGDDIAAMYAGKAGGTTDEWRAKMRANAGDGTWYTADEAVEAGLADEVGAAPAQAENTQHQQIIDFMRRNLPANRTPAVARDNSEAIRARLEYERSEAQRTMSRVGAV